MSAQDDIPQRLFDQGWMLLFASAYRVAFFRWLPEMTRDELHITFDKAGRVFAWSRWHNKRVSPPDQSAGNRTRLTDFIAEQVAS